METKFPKLGNNIFQLTSHVLENWYLYVQKYKLVQSLYSIFILIPGSGLVDYNFCSFL